MHGLDDKHRLALLICVSLCLGEGRRHGADENTFTTPAVKNTLLFYSIPS